MKIIKPTILIDDPKSLMLLMLKDFRPHDGLSKFNRYEKIDTAIKVGFGDEEITAIFDLVFLYEHDNYIPYDTFKFKCWATGGHMEINLSDNTYLEIVRGIINEC